ncbi:TetR/AcrR family transcriptional regulator [Williamsia sterculiae]|uniref:TetR/AcrR family transcriptional regulator n=1 Tax=Williamsia sterculiae TaxID=1344003 RepID=UPI0009FB84A6|nr:TetR family transcriptional regulator [Williamsia sterculiae]
MVRLSVQERRHAAVVSALRVIAADGVEAATTRRIADEAGVAQSSLFYAFDSRDDLLEAVVEYGIAQELAAMGRWLHDLAEIDKTTDVDASVLIRTALGAYVESLVADPDREHALVALALYARRTPGLELLSARLYAGYDDVVIRLLDELTRITGRRWSVPGERLAPITVALTDGITLAHLNTRDSARVEAILDGAVDLLTGYLAGTDEQH